MLQIIVTTPYQKRPAPCLRPRKEVVETNAVLYHNDQVELGAYPRRLDRAKRNRLLAD
jgi:hypothetical protein